MAFDKLKSLAASIPMAMLVSTSSTLLVTNAAQGADTLYRWDDRVDTNFITGGTDTGTVDGVSITVSGSAVGSTTDATLELQPSGSTNGFSGIVRSDMDATTDDGSVSNTVTFTFSEPVYNLRFTVVDVDGGPSDTFNDQVNLTSNNGFPSVTTTAGSVIIYNPATGIALANDGRCSTGSGNVPDCLLNVEFVQPVTTVSVAHVSIVNDDGDPAFQIIAIDDFLFNTPPIATDNANTTDEDNTGSGNLIGDDDGFGTDFDNQDDADLIVTSVDGTPIPVGGTTITLTSGALLTVQPDGSYVYDPNGVHNDLAPGQTAIETVTYVIEDQEGLSISDGSNTDSVATLTITVTGNPDPGFSVSKSVDVLNITSLPTTLNYTITVVNTGGAPLNNVTPVDTLSQNGTNTTITLTGPAGDTDTNDVLDFGETWTYTASHVVTQAQMDDANDLVNSVSVTTDETGGTPQTSQATTTIAANASMTVSKVADRTVNVQAGEIITYTYTVTNNGNQTITDIGLSESHNAAGPIPVPANETISVDNPPIGDSTDTGNDGNWEFLAPGDAVVFTAQYEVLQQDVDSLQ